MLSIKITCFVFSSKGGKPIFTLVLVSQTSNFQLKYLSVDAAVSQINALLVHALLEKMCMRVGKTKTI